MGLQKLPYKPEMWRPSWKVKKNRFKKITCVNNKNQLHVVQNMYAFIRAQLEFVFGLVLLEGWTKKQ